MLSHSLLAVPALEENLFWVGVEKTHLQYNLFMLFSRWDEDVSTHHSEVCDHFCPRNVELEQVGTVGANLMQEHVVGDIPLEGQLR